jgi:Leucine-rich repeat (LRR) protein
MNKLLVTMMMLMLLLIFTSSHVSAVSFPVSEMNALRDFHTTTNSEYWAWKEVGPEFGIRWDFTKNVSTGEYISDPCGGESNLKWQGITCVYNSSVLKIDLNRQNLTGYLPHTIGDFPNMTEFQMEGNHIGGSIPETIGNLTQLIGINLNYNRITGSLPLSMHQLTLLEQLWLTENFLSGTIPSEFGKWTALEWFHLADNLLTGSIPTTIGAWTNALAITFDYNLMTGPIPSEIGLLYEELEYLGVSNCDFSGTIPSELGDLQTAYYFFLQSNLLTGTIPPELGKLVKVDFFGLSNNRLTGTIPTELTALSLVRDLYMDANMFSGTVPVNLFDNFNTLQVLRLQRNILTGDLTGRFSGALPMLGNVDFSDNRLSGSVPADLFEVPNILNIALSLNCFEGSLPESICSTSNAIVLSLDGLGVANECKNEVKVPLTGVTIFNTLAGTVPQCVWRLPQLQVLHLTGNGQCFLSFFLSRVLFICACCLLPVASLLFSLSVCIHLLVVSNQSIGFSGSLPDDIPNSTSFNLGLHSVSLCKRYV